MPFPILAALPAIFTAIEGAAELFSAGKRTYEQVTGTASQATTAQQLADEIKAMPEDKIAQWVKGMELEIQQFKAETDRLQIEEGEVTAEILKVLPPAAAARVAVIRMTTRPVIALRMTHVILLPAYLLAVDSVITTINVFAFAWGSKFKIALVSTTLLDEGAGSIYKWLYEQATTPAAAIVATYMMVRSVEKMGGKDGLANSMKSIGGAAGAALAAIKGVFTKK
jgi:hypothetical protein